LISVILSRQPNRHRRCRVAGADNHKPTTNRRRRWRRRPGSAGSRGEAGNGRA